MKSTSAWLAIGFLGQAIFTARFLVQWLASERQGKSIVPSSFWWLSLIGGCTLLVYASYKQDPVIIVGQSLGVFVYLRNLVLVSRGATDKPNKTAEPELTIEPKQLNRAA